MDFYKNLPLPARIAIPAVLAIVVAFLVYSTMFKAPPPVELIATQDVDVYETAQQVLERKNIDVELSQDASTFMIAVPEADATTAAQTLAASGIKDRTGLAKKITCPAPPGFTATKAANERSTNCEAAKSVQGMLLAAGSTAANVQVSQEENGTLLGPEKSMNVVAQVFLPRNMKDNWNAEQAARAISRSVGTTLDRVSITDDQLQTLFDGSSAGGDDSSSGASAMALGCADIAAATEVETKRAAVRACHENNIGAKLEELLGGSDRFVLTVEPTIDSVARSRTTLKQSPGPETSRSEQTGSGQKVLDKDTPPNTSEETATDPAGDVTRLAISVILDKDNVTEDQRLAVMSLLSSQVNVKRGDPAPVVKMATFDGGAGDKPTNEDLELIKENAAAANQDPTPNGTGPVKTSTKMPAWAMAAMVALAIGMLTAVVVLWRRSTAMASERERLEQSFRNEQRLFEDFAQQNPDHLAQDLNALFGAPSAPEPSLRRPA
jgi:flagellar biosynthesis/type III secretory pathway M-ring protein FliF/YscJ